MLQQIKHLPLRVEGSREVIDALRRKDSRLWVITTGGGMAGASSIGFAVACEKLDFFPSNHFASSVGGINAVLQAYGLAKTLADCYAKHFCSPDFIRPGFWPWLTGTKVSLAFYETQVRQLLTEHLTARDRKLLSNVQVTVGLTCYETGDPVMLKLDLTDVERVARALRASAQLPFAESGYVLIDGHPFCDGGLSAQIGFEVLLEKISCTSKPKYVLIVMSTPEQAVGDGVSRLVEPAVLRWPMRKHPSWVRQRTYNRRDRFRAELSVIRQRMRDACGVPTCIIWPEPMAFAEQRRWKVREAITRGIEAYQSLLT